MLAQAASPALAHPLRPPLNRPPTSSATPPSTKSRSSPSTMRCCASVSCAQPGPSLMACAGSRGRRGSAGGLAGDAQVHCAAEHWQWLQPGVCLLPAVPAGWCVRAAACSPPPPHTQTHLEGLVQGAALAQAPAQLHALRLHLLHRLQARGEGWGGVCGCGGCRAQGLAPLLLLLLPLLLSNAMPSPAQPPNRASQRKASAAASRCRTPAQHPPCAAPRCP